MQRTELQNNSLHLWLEKLADGLNDAGFDVGDGQVIKVPVRFTKENLKENCLRPLMSALYPDITSTTQLSTTQIQELYLELDKIISERTGVTIPWPDQHSQADESCQTNNR